MLYRREIDGLRAVAVMPVILFHAGFTVFSGGFVGVDVFFVISGYLITTIIVSELRDRRFSLMQFYERRARRILPALFTVMACTLPFAWLWMYPAQLADYSRSMAATALFLSNVHFWEHTGYFATDSDLQPLLHTWSLAVEEQYYLLFPLILMLLGGFRRARYLWVILLLALASLALSEWGWRNEPDVNFFFTFSRFWELLAGSICAIYSLDRGPRNNEPLAALGLGLIVFSIFGYDDTTPFPSLWSLAPVGGTALIIVCAGPQTAVARILSFRLLVGIGLISYSAYLWHQPIFAFARIHSLHEPDQVLMLALSLLALTLAALSWRFVEQPFRRRPVPLLPKRATILTASAVGGAAFVAMGMTGYVTDGAPNRSAPNGQSWAKLALDPRLVGNPGLSRECSKGVAAAMLDPLCKTVESPKVLLWGDSYAMHLARGFLADQNAAGKGFVQLTKSQCAPILNLSQKKWAGAYGAVCSDFNDDVFDWLKSSDGIEIVVMSSPYNILGRTVYDREGQAMNNDNNEYALQQMRQTAAEIRKLGMRPIFVSAPPNDGSDLGLCLTTAVARGFSPDVCNFTQQEYSSWLKDAYDLLRRLDEHEDVAFLSELLCQDGECKTNLGDVFVYRDTGHFSVEGTIALGRDHDLFDFVLSQ